MSHLPEAKNNYEKAQRVLIGYLLLFPSTAPEVFKYLRKEQKAAFNVAILGQIFEAMEALFSRGIEIREESIISELHRSGKPTKSVAHILAECTDNAYDENIVRELGSEITDYIQVILDDHHLRLVKSKVQRATTYPEVLKIAEHAIALDAGAHGDYQRPVDEIIDELIDVQTAIKEGRKKPGYSWGIPELDDAILIRPGKLYTVAAQKGAGKTKFLLSTLDHNLSRRDDPVPCLLFSLEMSDLEVIKYLASRRAEVDSSLILTDSLNDRLFDDIKLSADDIRYAPLEIDTSPSLSVREIISRIRHWKIKNDVKDDTGIVGVDFLQLLTLERRNGQFSEATALKNAAYKLSEAAKTFRVSIIAVAQLNKQADGNRPEIGFIEGSGGLAQASQGVLLLDLLRLREGSRVSRADGSDDLNIIIAKNRDGQSMVTVKCRADLSIGKFYGSDQSSPGFLK